MSRRFPPQSGLEREDVSSTSRQRLNNYSEPHSVILIRTVRINLKRFHPEIDNR